MAKTSHSNDSTIVQSVRRLNQLDFQWKPTKKLRLIIRNYLNWLTELHELKSESLDWQSRIESWIIRSNQFTNWFDLLNRSSNSVATPNAIVIEHMVNKAHVENQLRFTKMGKLSRYDTIQLVYDNCLVVLFVFIEPHK